MVFEMQNFDFWKRKAELKLGDDAGDGLDFSEFRFTFNIKKTNTPEPNAAIFNIYNVSREIYEKVKKEFSRITLAAGYVNNYSLIFNGNIKQVIFYKENATDTVLSIAAGDGDEAFLESFTNESLAAGATQADVFDAAKKEYSKNCVGDGFLAEFDNAPAPRGRVLFGRSRHYLTSAAKNSGCDFSTQDRKVQVVKSDEALAGDVIVLNAKTGLIGTPALTNNGISATCLLNPLLKIGGLVKLNNNDIMQSLDNEAAAVDADGVYRVFNIEYSGDSMGNDWYCALELLGFDEVACKVKDEQ